MAHVDAIREVRIAEQTYHHRCKQYGGMGTDPGRSGTCQTATLICTLCAWFRLRGGMAARSAKSGYI